MAICLDLTERDCPHSCSFKSEGEAANSREKVKDIQPPTSSFSRESAGLVEGATASCHLASPQLR